MADQTSGVVEVALKWLGGLILSGSGLRFYFKARNAGHLDRIVSLERQNKEDRRMMNQAIEELKELASSVDIDRGDSHRRFQRVESDVRTLRRETRDKLLEIAENLDQQLSRSAAASQQPEPPAQR